MQFMCSLDLVLQRSPHMKQFNVLVELSYYECAGKGHTHINMLIYCEVLSDVNILDSSILSVRDGYPYIPLTTKKYTYVDKNRTEQGAQGH